MIKSLKKIAKAILKYRIVRSVLTNYNYYLFSILRKSEFLSSIYFTSITGGLKREVRAMSHGIFEYYRKVKKHEINTPQLRRNIHRIEKGIVMYPRRKVFALGYIKETIDLYEMLANEQNDSGDPNLLKWASGVLGAYFSVAHKKHPIIVSQAARFEKISKSKKSAKDSPYLRSLGSSVTYKNFLKLSKQRRSVRFFEKKKVDRKLIDKAIEAASLAPTACNRQPFRYLIFDKKELVKKVSHIPFGTAGYADNIPVVVVLVGDMSNFFSTRDRHLIYIDASLSAMAFMYALETLGLSSTGINWPDFGLLERKMAKVLGLKPFERPVMLMALGYPDKKRMVAYSKKKSIEKIRAYNQVATR